MAFVNVREVVLGREDDDRLNRSEVWDAVGMQGVMFLLTMLHRLSLFVLEAPEIGRATCERTSLRMQNSRTTVCSFSLRVVASEPYFDWKTKA